MGIAAGWADFEYSLFIWAVLFAIGLFIGSFINVAAHRLPKIMASQWRLEAREILELGTEGHEPLGLLFPRSRCPMCMQPLKWFHNIPIFGFIRLRGRCAHCQKRISHRYWLVELSCAILTLTVALKFGPNKVGFAYCGVAWLLLAAAAIDFESQLLPDSLTLFLLWIGLLFHALFLPHLLVDRVLAAAAGYLFFWVVFKLFHLATGKEGLGYGDFKLLAALGAWFGTISLVPIVLIASLIALAFAAPIWWRARIAGKDSPPMPFGPYLALAGILTLLFGANNLNHWTMNLFG